MNWSTQLLEMFVSSVHEVAGDVALDLTDDPPTIVARTSEGRVFAAAWPGDDGMLVRLRLDALPSALPGDRVGDGGLTYEVTLRTPAEVDGLAAMLRRAHSFTGRGDPDSRGIHSP